MKGSGYRFRVKTGCGWMIPAGTCGFKKGNDFAFEKKQSTDPRCKCVTKWLGVWFSVSFKRGPLIPEKWWEEQRNWNPNMIYWTQGKHRTGTLRGRQVLEHENAKHKAWGRSRRLEPREVRLDYRSETRGKSVDEERSPEIRRFYNNQHQRSVVIKRDESHHSWNVAWDNNVFLVLISTAL